MLVSVIIPALNEAERIERTLARVQAQEGPAEIIVSDGGSVDGTRDLSGPYARVITGARGRAAQMNRGAASATGSVLLFLHADTLLPNGALPAVRQAISEGAEAGAFRLRFDVETPLLRFYGWVTQFPIPRICFGDRGLFIRRSVFEEIGGFPEIPMFEDLEIVRLLHRRGCFRFMPLTVTTAARRFTANGPALQQLRNTYLWTHYVLGANAERLAHLYPYDVRKE